MDEILTHATYLLCEQRNDVVPLERQNGKRVPQCIRQVLRNGSLGPFKLHSPPDQFYTLQINERNRTGFQRSA